MNIVFFHSNGIIPAAGGISRITDILGRLFASKGNKVWYIGASNEHKNISYSEWQNFLPSIQLFANLNVDYIVNFVKEHKVDVVINQMALDPNSAKFLALCKKQADFLLVSCIHNSILTPIVNGAYQKEYILRKKGMVWLFYLMKTRMVTSILTSAYICKYRKSYSSTLNNSDKIVVLCDGQATELYRMCGVCFSEKVVVIPNSIDTNIELPKQKNKTVVWVGTFDYSIKRPDNMLRIWKQVEDQHPDWDLQMLGDGPSLTEMKALATTLELKRVVFTGRTNPDEYYKKASILCVTSVHESFSLVTVEAQRVGCVPVLNNSFRAAQLLVQDGVNGYLIPAFDNDAFANKLSYLMKDSNHWEELSRKSIEGVKKFSLDIVYNQWELLFKENVGC